MATLNGEASSATDVVTPDFDYVRFTWSDIHGIARCKSVPRRNVASMLEDGVGTPLGKHTNT
jgi:glutamine synthetase